MKKGLLLVSIFLASKASFGQLTQANEPSVGASATMYVADTGSVTMAGITAVTGSNVEWDYTTLGMDVNETQVISVMDATNPSTPNSADFPTSTKAISQGTIVQFFNSTASERVSQGFVFNEPTLGEVVVVFDTDEALQLTYPFNFGDASTDAYVGSTELNFGMPMTATVTGDVYTTIDGTGTLRLPDMDIADVFRLTTIDTTLVDAGLMSVEVIRVQHEYYDNNNIELPIFLDAYISASGLMQERQVLSKNFSTVGLSKNTIENVVLFPNPSTGEFAITGNFTKGNVEVTDLTGKVVYASEIVSGAKVELKDVKSGVYMVKLAADDKTSVQKITVK